MSTVLAIAERSHPSVTSHMCLSRNGFEAFVRDCYCHHYVNFFVTVSILLSVILTTVFHSVMQFF